MSKLNWKSIVGWGIAALVAGFIVYTNMQEQKALQESGKRNVYAVLPLTGTMAATGKEIKKTMEIYMQANPSMPFEVKFYDNESDPNKTISIARQIAINDENPLFTCSVSGLCRPLIPILSSLNGFLLLSPSPRAETEDWKEFQRISFSHLDTNQPFIDFVRPDQTVVIIHSNDETGHSGANLIAENLQKKGITVLKKVAFDHKELDNRITVLKAMSYNPDVIIVTAGPSMGFVKVIKTLKEQEYPGLILSDPSLRTPSLIALFSEKESEGVYVPVMPIARIQQEYPEVEKTLTAAGLELYNFTINTWDTMNIIKHFVSNNIPFNQDEFRKLGKWHGISGDIIFSDKGNSNYHFIMSVIKNGQFIPVESEDK
ncbi:MAG: ABC transporter substrate-binding protein [Alphaproteobacteria bacterium]|nr:ABC transporter substrate-binding protein [Alphaproteobacteria bacterium]